MPIVTRIPRPTQRHRHTETCHFLEPPTPLGLLLAHRPLDTLTRVVDGRLAADKDGRVVQKRTKESARNGAAPGTPKPVCRGKRVGFAVAEGKKREAGAKVAGWVHYMKRKEQVLVEVNCIQN